MPLWILLSLVSFVLLITSCSSSSPTASTFNGNAMTIDYHIIVGSLPSQRQIVQSIIFSSFEEIDTIYNKWNPCSELSFVNRQPGGIRIPISPKLEKLLLLTDKVVKLSDGRFDPTIEPVQQLWKRRLASGTIPAAEELESFEMITGWDKITICNGTLIKSADGISLDLGGIAKGYGVDLIVENLNQAGFSNVFVEWGGEIRASGIHPEGRPWRIFISRLENNDPRHAVAHLDVQDRAIATSGDYLQSWTVNGSTYFHIINPTNLQPLQMSPHSIAGASVLASNCALADGLATAAMMFNSVDEARIWAEGVKKEYPDLSFWILSRQNTH